MEPYIYCTVLLVQAVYWFSS